MTTVDVLRVGSDAWETWREIRLRSLRDSPDAFGSTYEREAEFAETHWRQRLDGPGPCVLVTSAGDPVAMGAGWCHEPGRLMVVAMWTDPRVRGRGLGTRVLDEIVGWARQRDLRPELWVADGNPAARLVYERYGFVADGEAAPLREGSALQMRRLVLPDGPVPG
jgi:GNAT superfamily N-acetyltransferase